MKLQAIVAILALVAGCANPSVVRVKSGEIAASAITTVYVPRFEGSPNFVEESTDFFVSELESRMRAKVRQGPALRAESPDVLAGGNLAPDDLAIAAARKVGAQAVILGKVTSHNGNGMLNGYSTVRVIKVSDGSILASFHRPSGALIANSEHQAVMDAVERTAKDVAGALK